MVVLNNKPETNSSECPIVGKREKTHTKPIVGLWCFRKDDRLMLISAGHDCLKLWGIDEAGGIVAIEELDMVKSWRCGIQSADVTADGQLVTLIGTESILYEIMFTEESPSVMKRDMGYMEAWHIKISHDQTHYMTTSLSGHISEIDMDGKFSRREPFKNVKQISCIAYSDDDKFLAVANSEGNVALFDVPSFKVIQPTYEAHAMRINDITFLPSGNILTASDDKTLRLHDLSREKPTAVQTYCSNLAPVVKIALDRASHCERFASCNLRGTIIIWLVDQSTPLMYVPSPHESSVYAITFSVRGDLLFSAGEDKRIVAYRISCEADDEEIPGNQTPEADFDQIEDGLSRENEDVDMAEEDQEDAQNYYKQDVRATTPTDYRLDTPRIDDTSDEENSLDQPPQEPEQYNVQFSNADEGEEEDISQESQNS